jgi:acetylornithine/N-succinyldiaminopimelate aminotransferase
VSIAPVLPTYARAPLAFERGEGVWLETADGTRYLDLGAGIAVNALGHANPVLVRALEAQARKLWHTSNLYVIPNQEALARALTAATFADTVFFTNSGAEAIECAIKMARKYFSHIGQPERHRIVTFEGSFHGRTMAGISAAGSEKLTKGFGPLLPGFDHVAWGDHEGLRAAIGPETAAILIEPIQGEGGIRPLPVPCLRGLRALCDEHGLLLILDEIQCGMGRTGKLFAHEWAGIAPDIMAIAKAIGGGFPLGACLATEKAAQGMVVGSHGSTYGGNPLACAVGLAVMGEITAPGFLERVGRAAGHMRQRLEGLVAGHPRVFEAVRGEGLMLGLRCRVPMGDVVTAGYGAQVIVVPAADNVVRLLPPLTITPAEIDEGVARLDRAASAIEAALEPAK